MPIYSYNGGYYSYNPIVLDGFYKSNGFNEIKAYIIMWDRFKPFSERHRCYEYTDDMVPRYALADRDQARFVPHLLLFARKVADVERIISPLQSNQMGPGHSGARANGQSRQQVFFKLVRLTRRPIIFETVFYLHALLRREWTLRRNHRRSFWI